MLGRLYFLQDINNSKVGADDKGSPFGPEIFLAVHALFDPDAVVLNYLLIRITEERERQPVLFDKLFVAFCGIDANPKKLCSGLNFTPGISKVACLPRASWRVVFRIEVKHQRRSFEIVQFHRLSGSINAPDGSCLKCRGSITNFQLYIHECRKLSRLRSLRNPLRRAFTRNFARGVATLE
jgi:hypothetical protein